MPKETMEASKSEIQHTVLKNRSSLPQRSNLQRGGSLPVSTITLMMLLAGTPAHAFQPRTNWQEIKPRTRVEEIALTRTVREKPLTALVTLTRAAHAWSDLDDAAIVTADQVFPAYANVESLVMRDLAKMIGGFSFAIFKQETGQRSKRPEWRVLQKKGSFGARWWEIMSALPEEWLNKPAGKGQHDRVYVVPQGIPVLEKMPVAEERQSFEHGFPAVSKKEWDELRKQRTPIIYGGGKKPVFRVKKSYGSNRPIS